LQKYASVITSDFAPFGLHRARVEDFFTGPSIFSLRKTERPQFSYVDFPCYVSQTFFVILTNRANLKFLTGLLNSRLIYYWLKNSGKLQGSFLQVDKVPLLGVPVCVGSKAQQKTIISLVDKIMVLQKEIRGAIENSDLWLKLKSEIEKTDARIDAEVYKLYGLTADEIKIIEKK
jgi:adenine-specific DNA-methyltransferase